MTCLVKLPGILKKEKKKGGCGFVPTAWREVGRFHCVTDKRNDCHEPSTGKRADGEC
jgi:hypothetical protein